jgi:fused signal recognition particle receptor
MVFDWFKRNLQPAPPAAEGVEEDRAETAPPGGPESAQALDRNPADPLATVNLGSDQAVPAPSPPVPATTPAPAPDDDALAWARQAYARLKAEQQAQKAGAQSPGVEPEPAPPAPAPLTPVASPVEAEAAEVVEALPANPAQAPSLLEQAAATRVERQQALTAAAEPTEPERRLAAAGPPPATGAPPSQGADEPQLGAFDDSFTWSAEVLAAQGRRPDQISLEEIDWLGRLRQGLEKTRRGFVTQLLDNLGDDPLTPEVLDDLETTLLRADVGVSATDQVLEALRQRLNQEVVDPSEGIRFLKEQLRGILDTPIEASAAPLLAPQKGRLNVWLLVGVNGVGKTTTLGKLANLAVRSGYSCLIAAADTFRAAAVQQVQVWGERSGVPVIANPSANADPAAVVYDAIGAAQAHGTELVLVDTAGRLQTKHNLMEELAKVRRIVDKLAPEAAVESLLVLDASQGQNGLRQAMAFASAAGLTGVVVTKLDGSARGGVALAVASEAGLPIRFIGAGEGIRDLRPFNSFEFVEALLAS